MASKQKKICPTSYLIRDFQINMRCRYTPIRMAKIQVTDKTKCWSEAVEQQEFSFTDGGNENWYSHYERQSDTFWQNTLLPYDPIIKILSIYPELKTYVHTKKTCIWMFIAAYSYLPKLGTKMS